jgi:hypothetical protein
MMEEKGTGRFTKEKISFKSLHQKIFSARSTQASGIKPKL